MADNVGLIAVVSNDELVQQEQAQALAVKESQQRELAESQLAKHIRTEWEAARDHRESSGLTRRLVDCLQSYNGEYSADKLSEIRQFGGSEVYARLTTSKCRGATALLRDVFMSTGRFWGLDPTPIPDLPEDISQSIDTLLQEEMKALLQQGIQPDPSQIEERRAQLYEAATKAAVRNARKEAKKSEEYIDDILIEGGFYDAFVEFLADLPIFPYAVMKGPVFKHSIELDWTDGQMQTAKKAKMYWTRVSPFDIYFTPGASRLRDSAVFEKIKLTRAELTAAKGIPGYSTEAITAVLDDYEYGLVDWMDSSDQPRADSENRESPTSNRSHLIDGLEYHGPVRGAWLLEWGFSADQITEPSDDYYVTAWLVGTHVIKVHINPNPRQESPYYVSCFERVPGSIVGQALPEIVGDVQDVANAVLRSLVNNTSISSGPQVAVNEEMLSPTTDGDSLYPWKRWRFMSDPMNNNQKPIDFFQPQSNANELLQVYKEMTNIADEVSAIPRYLTGGGRAGGAASTASGLSMLMGNSSKILQNVAANIDSMLITPALHQLYNILMLTDQTGVLRGDEQIVVKGATMAMAKEQDRMRRLEFLQMTANPLDQQIMGLRGRAKVLGPISSDLGLPGEEIVPPDEVLEQMEKAQQAAQQAAAQAEGDQAPAPKQDRLGRETDNMHRVQK